MIQRKQTIYLLLAAIILVAGFIIAQKIEYNILHKLHEEAGYEPLYTFIENYLYCASVLCLISVPLICITIFLFKNRKLQMRINSLSILINLIMGMVMGIMWPLLFSNYEPIYFVYSVTAFIALLFLILAQRGIKADEKLIRSVDRIR